MCRMHRLQPQALIAVVAQAAHNYTPGTPSQEIAVSLQKAPQIIEGVKTYKKLSYLFVDSRDIPLPPSLESPAN